ncbi:MAG TPA: hypothetical protein VMW66_04220 [Elusimicrobiales bacterium]|nr:hypothetical protein [Elusimicrobiales bacterium]
MIKKNLDAFIVVTVVILVLFLTRPSDKGLELYEYQFKECGFSVLLPAEVTKAPVKEFVLGKGIIKTYLSYSQKDELSFTAECSVYPDGYLNKENALREIEKAKKVLSHSLNALITGERLLEFNEGYTAREIHATVDEDAFIMGRIYVTDNKVYQTFTVLNETVTRPNVYKFLNSFKIITEK